MHLVDKFCGIPNLTLTYLLIDDVIKGIPQEVIPIHKIWHVVNECTLDKMAPWLFCQRPGYPHDVRGAAPFYVNDVYDVYDVYYVIGVTS